jgi:hypothetical protein
VSGKIRSKDYRFVYIKNLVRNQHQLRIMRRMFSMELIIFLSIFVHHVFAQRFCAFCVILYCVKVWRSRRKGNHK